MPGQTEHVPGLQIAHTSLPSSDLVFRAMSDGAVCTR